MHLAFPAATLPELALPGVIRVAADNALALELHAGGDANIAVATNLSSTDPRTIGRMLSDAGVPLAAVWLAVPIAAPAAVVAELARAAEAAAAAGCATVRLFESRPTPPAVLRAAGNAAAVAGVRLTIDNPPLRSGTVDVWHRLDVIDHPSVACCLDTLHAALGGDGPSMAVPTLGTRIAHVRLRHPVSDAETVHRLAGIGYGGFLSISTAGGTVGLVAAATAVRPWLPKSGQKHI